MDTTTTRNHNMSQHGAYVTHEGNSNVHTGQVLENPNTGDDAEDESDFSDFESDEFDDYDDYDSINDSPLQDSTDHGTGASGHRRERVRELVATELEYVHDLEILIQVTTGDAAKDKYNVFDFKVVLGNITEVMDVARRFSQELKNVAHCKEEEMVVGKVFRQFRDELTEVYKVYCSSYNVDVLPLIKKYESEESTSVALKQVAEELRSHKRHLLDLNCVLIKPVQRFLKYPLYLQELVHSTPESHVDFSDLQAAKKSFHVAAKDINEYTRAIDLVHKYRDYDNSLHGKIRRMNLRSLARKSFRATTKLSQKLGVVEQTLNYELSKLEIQFQTVQKAAQILVKNATSLVEAVRSRHTVELVIAEIFVDIFPEAPQAFKVKATALESCNKVLKMFDNEMQQRVLHPARQIVILCEGPANLIQKTRRIMLDYDMAQIKLQAALEPSRISSVIEESAGLRATYEALSSQLVSELPIFLEHSIAILTISTQSLVGAHMYLQGHLARLYLKLALEPGLTYITPEEAREKAKKQVEELLQLLPPEYQKKYTTKKKDPVVKKIEKEPVEIRSKSQERGGETSKSSSSADFFKSLPSISKSRSRRSSPLNSNQNTNQAPKEPRRVSAPYDYFKSWSPSGKIHQRKSLYTLNDGNQEKTQKKTLLDKQYPSEVLYKVVEEHAAVGDNELSLHTGDVVAVLKKKDPMGGEGRWVVDDGDRIGLIRPECLKLAQNYGDVGERPRSISTPASTPVLKSVSQIRDSSSNRNQVSRPELQNSVPVPGFVSRTHGGEMSNSLPSSYTPLRQDLPPAVTSLRQDLPPTAASLRQDLPPAVTPLRQDLPPTAASLRQDLSPTAASLRQDLSPTAASLRQDLPPATVTSLRQDLPPAAVTSLRQDLPPTVTSLRQDLSPAATRSLRQYLPSAVVTALPQDIAQPEEEYSDSSDEWDLEDNSDNKDCIGKDLANSSQEKADLTNQPHLVQQQQYVALYNFTGAEDSQLNLKKGQVVVGIHTEYDDWWYMKDDYGNQGYVPASYLVKQV